MATVSNARLVALVVASAFFMQNLDGAIISTSLPQMARAFAITPAAMTIGVPVYLVATAVFLPLSGWIADRFGARNVFAGAIVIFTVSSLACGLRGRLWAFVLGRAG